MAATICSAVGRTERRQPSCRTGPAGGLGLHRRASAAPATGRCLGVSVALCMHQQMLSLPALSTLNPSSVRNILLESAQCVSLRQS